MSFEIKLAITPEEQEAVYRLRYDLYVKEMGFCRARADDGRQRLKEAHDEGARLLYAEDDGAVVGTLRLHLGCDAPLPDEYRATYQLDRFKQVVPLEQMSVLSRFMVRPDYRGTLLPFLMIIRAAQIYIERGIELAFLDCQPHLLNLYRSLGARPCAPLYNDEDGDLLVPLIWVIKDKQYLEAIRSPGLPFVDIPPSDVPGRVVPLIPTNVWLHDVETAVSAEEWSQIYAALASRRSGRVSLLEGLTDAEVHALLSSDQILDCHGGQCIVRKGQTARTIFVVLRGTVEVRDDAGRTVATMSEGDVFGEVSFLLSGPRISDVYAVGDDVRVLALREKTMQRMIEADSRLAAKVLLNLAKGVCLKLMERAGAQPR